MATGRVGNITSLGVTVEAAFGYDPDDPSPVWTDISTYAVGFSTRRGRRREIDRVTAGSCLIRFENPDRRFEPGYTGGPYGSNVVPMTPIRITCTRNAVTYPVFYGFADEWVPSLEPAFPKTAFVDLRATDAFKVLAMSPLPDSVWAYEVQQDAPVKWYRFLERAGTIDMLDTAGTATGVYANGLNNRKAQTLLPYVDGGTLEFNGSDHRANVPVGAGLVTPPLTVETIIRTPDTLPATLYLTIARQGNGGPPYAASGGAGTNSSWALRITPTTDSAPHRITAEYSGAASNLEHSAGPIKTGTVYHVLWTTSSTGSNGTLYINGGDQATTGGGNANLGAVAGTAIGGVPAPGTPLEGLFEGAIQEFIVYDSALSAGRADDHWQAAAAPWNGDLTGGRITKILDAVGYSATARDLDNGLSYLGPIDLEGRSAIDLLWETVDAETGAMFIARDGDLTFIDRSALFTDTTRTTSQATYSYTGSNSKARGVTFDSSDELIRNHCVVTSRGGATGEAQDATSIGRYYKRTEQITVPDGSQNLCQALAEWTVLVKKDPQRRITSLKVPTSRDTTTFDQTLGLELGYRVTVTLDPPGTGTSSEDVFVEGVDHHVTPTSWATDLWCSPVSPVDVFVIGTDAVGSAAIIGY